jgi:CHAD domain-containing protein
MVAMTDVHLEIEQKYDVLPSFVLPSLDDAVPGLREVETEVAEMEAIYFDTADLRLANRRMTLRRRSGGADAGWHLKLPVAKGERQELQEPFTDELSVPETLRQLVTATTRGADLVPVARLATTRTAHRLRDEDGQLVLEVADDSVTGQTLGAVTRISSWREVEVELIEGQRAHLEQLAAILGAAGALPSASGSKLARTIGVSGRPAKVDLRHKKVAAHDVVLAYLRKQQSALLSTDPAVRLDQAMSVHKMRVASRRLRSALHTFAPLFTGDAHLGLETELSRLADVLGAERDADVLLERLIASLDGLPADTVVGPVREDVTSWMGEQHAEAKWLCREYLDSADYTRLLDLLDTFLAEPPLTDGAALSARTVMVELVDKTINQVRKTGREALAAEAGVPRDLALHDARRAAKRSRYAADVFAMHDPKPAKAVAAQMTDLQDTLGDRQDGAVMALLLRDFAERTAAAGGNAFTYGFLLAREEARGVNAERDFAAALLKLRPLDG